MTSTHHASVKHKVFRWPIMRGVFPINPSQASSDVAAGLTLAALAIPEVMGYTKISQTPVITGLYTLLLPVAIFAMFGSSRHLVVGADSATAAILASGLTGIATPGSPEWIGMSSVLALLTACILGLARLARIGFLADFLSRTVLTGFLTGVGVQVALGEVPGLLGLQSEGHSTISKLVDGLRHIARANLCDLLVAICVFAVVLGARRLSRRIPGALISVVGAIILSWLLDLQARGVSTLGPVPGGLPAIVLPQVDPNLGLVERLLPTAFAMFIVILAQSAATARAYAARYREALDENTDLVGLALANVGAGLSGTFVVNGSPTKTQMVVGAGGRSQLAQLSTAVVVVLVLLFLTRALSFMPQAVLSAVVFLIGIELIDVRAMRTILAQRLSEFWVALITAIVVVAVGVEQGILAAIGLSLVNHVRLGYRPKNHLIVRGTTGGLNTVPVAQGGELRPGLLVYHFNHSMYYANVEQLSEQVTALVASAEPPLRCFAIDMVAVDDVDFTAAETLRSLRGILQCKGVRLVLLEVAENVRAELERYRLLDLLPNETGATVSDFVLSYDRDGAPGV